MRKTKKGRSKKANTTTEERTRGVLRRCALLCAQPLPGRVSEEWQSKARVADGNDTTDLSRCQVISWTYTADGGRKGGKKGEKKKEKEKRAVVTHTSSLNSGWGKGQGNLMCPTKGGEDAGSMCGLKRASRLMLGSDCIEGRTRRGTRFHGKGTQ